jgi:hypothetical protein
MNEITPPITVPPHSRGAPKEWDITQDIVRELLDYNLDTGRLTWRARDRRWFKSDRDWKFWNTRYAGKSAMVARSGAYLACTILSRPLLTHRVIWFWMTGFWPSEIDHINGDGTDNRWINLREVTRFGEQSKSSAAIH